MDNLTAVRFDFENNNWIVHRFENKAEAFNFLEADIYQRAFKKIFKDERSTDIHQQDEENRHRVGTCG
jgi:hypothetical protein